MTIAGFSKEERTKKAKEVLQRVGLRGSYKKHPNQLSGGQMQRVAIARALVNDPDILLADEPTGALDSKTSVQIMDLIKEIAGERLVIMVTHNPELAEKYSTRIVRIKDGEVVDDSNPFTDEEKQKKKSSQKKVDSKKSKMSIWTAFKLSAKNLFSKRGRTAMVGIAGSIGIIGIALILAVSTGFEAYMSKLQSDTMSAYPITISEWNIDLEGLKNLGSDDDLAEYTSEQKLYTRTFFNKLISMLKKNDLSKEYVSYLENFVESENDKLKEKDSWKYSIKKKYGFNVNDYLFSNINFVLPEGASVGEVQTFEFDKFVMPINTLVQAIMKIFAGPLGSSDMGSMITPDFVYSYIPTLCEMPDNINLIKSQYEIIDDGGRWAENENELMLVVDSKNAISDITLALLGIQEVSLDRENVAVEFTGEKEFSFEDIKNKSFYYVKNDNRYFENNSFLQSVLSGMGYYPTADYLEDVFSVEDGELKSMFRSNTVDYTELKIVGVVRLKEGVNSGVLSTGLAYTSAFTKKILKDNAGYLENDELKGTSKIVKSAIEKESQGGQLTIWSQVRDVISGATTQTSFFTTVAELAGSDKIKSLSVYSVDYDSKERLKDKLDAWNDDMDSKGTPEKKVTYSDSTDTIFAALNTVINAVKIVLIAFTSISLVVSSIMIGIITYVSVVERTKEIGILRSIGARKKDISRIFNAETFIIGLLSGGLGVGITYLLMIPINIFVGQKLANIERLAMLPWSSALILVAISVVLTLVAGIIPSSIASKKDPVIALRTE